jgi:tetratricopeptide (TPR) repeat protein
LSRIGTVGARVARETRSDVMASRAAGLLGLTVRFGREHPFASGYLMSETSVNALPVRLQKQIDQARTAIDRNNTEYAVSICRQILASHPGCLGVRRLLRAAQLKVFRAKNPIVARVLGSVHVIRFVMAARGALKKDSAKAMDLAERALDFDPTSASALSALADAARVAGLFETAVFALESLPERAAGSIASRIALTEALVEAGRANEGLRIADALQRERPGDASIQSLVKKASVAHSISAGNWQSDSDSFRDKLRDEHEAVSLEQEAKAVTGQSGTERLLADALARLESEPTNINHFRSAITAYRTLGRVDDALACLARARSTPAGSADVSLERLEGELVLLRLQGRIAARESELAGAGGGDPAADHALRALREEFEAERISTARRIAGKYPNDLGLRYELGVLLLERGEVDAAIQQFQSSQRSPRHRLGALRNLGRCFQAKGLHDLALQQFQTARGELPGFDDEKKDIVYSLAACLEAMGRNDEALVEYKAIYSVDIGFRDVAAKVDRFHPNRG